MGTSGAFGGSASSQWTEVQGLFDAIEPTPPSATTPNESPSAEAFWKATVQALLATEKTLKAAHPTIAVKDLLPRRAASGGVTSKAGPVSATGRSRRTSQQIGRGAAAIAAGYALSRGRSADLQALGFTLADFGDLGPRARCQRILDEVLGVPGHPDDEALRRAVQPTLLRVLTEGIDDPVELIREFLAAYVTQAALVELSSKHAKGGIPPAETDRKEKSARAWIRAKVRSLPLTVKATTPQAFVDLALQLTKSILMIVGATT